MRLHLGRPQAQAVGDAARILPAKKHGETFPVPEGCKEITRAEWDLLKAEAKVDAERRERMSKEAA